MATVLANVFLTPRQDNPNEAELRTFPEPVVANIIFDPDTGDLIEIDQVFWTYLTQSPVETIPSFPGSPAPETVFLEVRFAPLKTPFPSPTNPPPSGTSPAEGDGANYGSVGTVPIAANEPRLDAGISPPGEEQLLEEDGGFEFKIRFYKYTAILTAPGNVYSFDPFVKIRHRGRRLF